MPSGNAIFVPTDTLHHMSGDDFRREPDTDFSNRLQFLYRMTEDTQGTIRFLDTKAAFCVTLLSGMAAVALQRPHKLTTSYHVLLPCFLAVTIISLIVCMRVIFPTIRPSGSFGAPADPKFYIGHNKAHHWILHTIGNPINDVLSETHSTYLAALKRATDADLLSSMCDTVLILALIRQVKSDRLHAAMICLTITVLLFAAVISL
jgi:hypothetical protein